MKVKFLEPKVHISFTSDQVIQLGCAVLHSIRLNLALISVWYKMFCRIAFLVCASYCCGNPFFNEGGWRNICDMLLCLTGSALHLVICISDLKQGKINLIPRFNLEWFTFCSWIKQVGISPPHPQKKNPLLGSKLMMARFVEILHIRFLLCSLVCFLQDLFDGGHRLPDSLQAHIRWPVKEPRWRHGKIAPTLHIIQLQNKQEFRFALSRRFGRL